mmetsp:Transcript_809/g.1472  ORF Transcript_809/g.1472 Transcript_809/m.1472 type:complete len:265 (+) Transcript_809:419-1213(+)
MKPFPSRGFDIPRPIDGGDRARDGVFEEEVSAAVGFDNEEGGEGWDDGSDDGSDVGGRGLPVVDIGEGTPGEGFEGDDVVAFGRNAVGFVGYQEMDFPRSFRFVVVRFVSALVVCSGMIQGHPRIHHSHPFHTSPHPAFRRIESSVFIQRRIIHFFRPRSTIFATTIGIIIVTSRFPALLPQSQKQRHQIHVPPPDQSIRTQTEHFHPHVGYVVGAFSHSRHDRSGGRGGAHGGGERFSHQEGFSGGHLLVEADFKRYFCRVRV